jgi:imidazole glycerol-phosphate synthase subunit HisH
VSPRVTVIDYGIGNVHSVLKALRHEGAEVLLSGAPDDIVSAERLVLPGVGAFGDGMRALAERRQLEPIFEYARRGRPLLGICLGMQLLLAKSEEFGSYEGLGLIAGSVLAIEKRPHIKVPQIGWNRIVPRPGGSWRGTLLEPLEPGTMMYFVHSFTAVPADERDRLADADYGGQRISAAVQRGNVIGCQFHPEKSGSAGLRVIDRFLAA